MLVPKPFYKKPRFWRWAIPLVLLFILVYVFHQEIQVTLDYLISDFPLVPQNLTQLRSVLIVFVLVAFGVIEFLFLFFLFVSQFVLPVQKPSDRWMVFKRLWYYTSGTHGPAVFIQEGEEIARPEELQSYRPGVAFVDLSSAVVLERQWSGGGSSTTRAARVRSSQSEDDEQMQAEQAPRREQAQNAKVRAAGPGIVFTNFGERLRGTVSLRKQVRGGSNIRGITRDGFEIVTQISCVFTLGQPPEVLKVIYQGETNPENLRVLIIDETKNIVKRISGDLDADDAREIHRTIQNSQVSGFWTGHQPVSDENLNQAPFVFDAERVFNAVYGERRLLIDGNVQDWTTLPVQVAVEIFRDMLSIVNYDDLYKPADALEFPFKTEFRPSFSARVRNQGVLAYQFVQRKDGLPFEVGQNWDIQQVDLFPTANLITSKVLRDRGIRIIAAGCGELRPTNPAVFQQRFNHWQAGWQRTADYKLASHESQALQIRAHARALTQYDIGKKMVDLLKSKIPDEVLAMRLLESLEDFASEPETKRLLPQETINMISMLEEWINPG